MGLSGLAGAVGLAVVGGVLSKLVAGDIEAWSPHAVTYLIQWAISRLPEDQRDRLREEWSSHVDEVPGTLSKLVTAAGFVWASVKIGRDVAARDALLRKYVGAIRAEETARVQSFSDKCPFSLLAVKGTVVSAYARRLRIACDEALRLDGKLTALPDPELLVLEVTQVIVKDFMSEFDRFNAEREARSNNFDAEHPQSLAAVCFEALRRIDQHKSQIKSE